MTKNEKTCYNCGNKNCNVFYSKVKKDYKRHFEIYEYNNFSCVNHDKWEELKVEEIRTDNTETLENALERIAELEKENTELKERIKWYSEQICNKECAEVWGELTKAAEEYIKTHDDYRVFALDDADIMQIFKDGAEFGFRKGIKAKINTTTVSDCPIKAQSEGMSCCDGEQDKPNVFQRFCKKEFPEDIQRRVERAAEYGESNAEYFFRAGFFLAHELEETKKNQDGGKR